MTLPYKPALKFLQAEQNADGSFTSYSTAHPDTFAQAQAYQTTFFTSLIAAALAPDTLPAQHIRKQATKFLLRQASAQGSFNYWDRSSAEATTTPYPDDWDDTAAALIAITQVAPRYFTGEKWAALTKLLISSERHPGGPYHTWLLPKPIPKPWNDVDVAVNAQLAYFLSLHEIDLPKLGSYLSHQIHTGELRSPYYPTSLPIIYYLARVAKKDDQAALAAALAPFTQEPWTSPLAAALTLSSLIRLQSNRQLWAPTAAYLKKSYPWSAEPFCLDPARDGKRHYAGSTALTTAFALEALHLFQQRKPHPSTPTPSSSQKPPETSYQPFAAQVHTYALAVVQGQDTALNQALKQAVNRLFTGDTRGEISALPLRFAQALGQEKTHSPLMLTQLGGAELLGWTAYSLFDDFLDNEGQPPHLPVATSCLRASLNLFTTACPQPEFARFLTETLNQGEAAHYWEAQHCHFVATPEYVEISQHIPIATLLRRLSDRSLGHILAPVGLLVSHGYSTSGFEAEHTAAFFRHYLLARQLHDDLHDWEDDLRHGNLTPVVALLLKSVTGQQALPDLLTQLRHQFWTDTIATVTAILKKEVRKASSHLREQPHLLHPNYLEELLLPLETGAQELLRRHQETTHFIRAYQG